MEELSPHIVIEIPGKLRLRQMLITVFFIFMGVLWILAPRDGNFEWTVFAFFILLVASLFSSWFLLPVSIRFYEDRLLIERSISSISLSYSDITAWQSMPQTYWWGKKYPGVLLRAPGKRVLLAGFLADSRVELDLMDALRKYIPQVFN